MGQEQEGYVRKPEKGWKMEKSGKSQNQHAYWCHLIYELYDDNEQTLTLSKSLFLTLFHNLRDGISQQAKAWARNASVPIKGR